MHSIDLGQISSASLKIKNETGFLKAIDLSGNRIGNDLTVLAKEFAGLPIGKYEAELWVDNGNGEFSIYPDDGFLDFTITENAVSAGDGQVAKTVDLSDYEARFQTMESEINEKLGNANEEISEAIKESIEVKDNKLYIAGKEAVDLSVLTHGKDGLTPTIGENGDWFVGDEDTGKPSRGEKGNDGDPGQQGEPGKDGKSAYQIWLDLGNHGTEQDFLDSLKGPKGDDGKDAEPLTTKRHGPTGFTLDRTTTPWTIWFDNGCGLQLPWASPKDERGSSVLVYSYGYNGPTNSLDAYAGPMPELILSTSRGTFQIENFVKANTAHFQYYKNFQVINPVNNKDDYDWTNAYGGTTFSGWNPQIKSAYTQLMYELGIWSANDVEYLGAIKKVNN